jgi:putative DNA methylase
VGAYSKESNPAFSHVDVPLASSFVLSSKAGKEAYVQPVVDGDKYRFEVKVGTLPSHAADGTKVGRGGNFKCLVSDTPIPVKLIREQGQQGTFKQRLMAVVAEGKSGRVYLSPTQQIEDVANSAKPEWKPTTQINHNPRDIRTQLYGLNEYGDLFTPRQLVALTTFSDLVQEARNKVIGDSKAAGINDDGLGIDAGGKGATAYGDALAVYLAFTINQVSG